MSPLIRIQTNSFPTKLLGKQLYHFDQLASTNTTALQLAQEGVVEGSVIMADSQSAGRGQGVKQWHSPAGAGLYCSIILRPELDLSAICPLTLSVGIAAAQTIAKLGRVDTQIKWPNDLILRGKKVGGILLETVSQETKGKHLVIGMGINLNQTAQDFPPDIRKQATSLQIETGMVFERLKFLQQLLISLENVYFLFLSQGLKPLIPQFDQLDYLYGEQITVSTPIGTVSGIMSGIDETGALLLRILKTNKIKRIISGSVQLVSPHNTGNRTAE